MIIIYGTDSSHRGTKPIVEKCVDCNKSNVQEVLVFQKYAHLYKLPFFPTDKEAVVRCKLCGNRIREYAMLNDLLRTCNEVKKDYSIPWWTFSGFGVVALIIVAIVFSAKHNHRNYVSFLKHPKAGDVYNIDLETSSYYTWYKVAQVKGDTVFLFLHSHSVSESKSLSGLIYEGEFINEPIPVLKPEIMKMYESGEIMSVVRSNSDMILK